MDRRILLIGILVLVIISVASSYFVMSYGNPHQDEIANCMESGGQIVTTLCCKGTDEFPNSCLVGSCGCSPANSRETRVCDCGPGKCFDGDRCVPLS